MKEKWPLEVYKLGNKWELISSLQAVIRVLKWGVTLILA